MAMQRLESIHASTEWRRHPIRTGTKDRVCAEEMCATILSRYNPRKKCSVHERKPPTEDED